MSFLDGYEQRALTLPDAHGLQPVGLVLGQGPNALEVAIARSPVKPTPGRGPAAYVHRPGASEG